MDAIDFTTIICDFEEAVDEPILDHITKVSVVFDTMVIYFLLVYVWTLFCLTVVIPVLIFCT